MKYGVIVAEDELLLQKNLIKKINESPTDFQVVGAAQTGVQALELIEKEVPFLLVTDIRMPVMDGLELIQRAREINPDLDAIIVSGYSEFEYAQTAIHLQVREYLLKPVERKKLEETLLSLQHDYEIKKQDLEKARDNYPEYSNQLFLIRYHMNSVLEALRHHMRSSL